MILLSKEEISEWFKGLQKEICFALENEDEKEKFTIDAWEHIHGGGGISTIIQNGNVIEKGGVNFSEVTGQVPNFLISESEHSITKSTTIENTFFATGVSIVIHPKSPLVPIIHMNIRYFETNNGVWWFGGGIDLTPHYINDSDAKFFHQQLKSVCDKHNSDYYAKYKNWADDYFYIPHRKETRGIGGIFFDRLTGENPNSKESIFEFIKDIGKLFTPTYIELIKRNKQKPFTDIQKNWQLLRRGRYVEFNLVYDKGTQFGLQTDGRIESILMSLPQLASWQYNFKANKDSEEERTLKLLKKGIDWIS
jgi:coproporphyrinogen III oxidase